MTNEEKSVIKHFGNKLRVRCCGLLIEDNKILLVKHQSINKSGFFYAPPGGGLNYSEAISERIKDEFLEETGLTVRVKSFLFLNELLELPLHAIELFHEVEKINGCLITGIDPELPSEEQIISDVRFYTLEEIKNLPKDATYGFLQNCKNLNDLLKPN